MATDLENWVSRRIDEDDSLDDGPGLIVLAALEGESALDAYLDQGTSPEAAEGAPEAIGSAPEPPGTFLKSLTVEGFRGIGEATTVELVPGPGLTVISGRNGSGKSSLAEGLELLLTGGTYRWKNKPAQWSDRWRNLHHETSQVSAELAQEGSPITTLHTSWDPQVDDVDDRTTWAQVKGQKRIQGEDPLGWRGALETYRPLLSYDELSGLLEGRPSDLYDAIATVLGVEQLTDGLKRIQQRLKALKAPGTELDRRRKALVERAKQLTADERAGQLARLLSKRPPQLEGVRDLVTGVTLGETGPVARLRELSNLRSPEAEDVERVSRRLRAAVAAMAQVGEAEAGRQHARLELRRAAVRLHEQHGEMSCPVCAKGALDETWAEQARALNNRESSDLDEVSRAAQELRSARDGARRTLSQRPASLDSAPLDQLQKSVSEARRLWDAWRDVPDGDLELCQHLEVGHGDLEVALEVLRVEAVEALTTLDDSWTPLATEAASWCDAQSQWLATTTVRAELASAEKWLKENDTRLKNERLEPIEAGAKRAWEKLRQESNVDLGALRLEGSATRRRVSIEASVDGSDAAALSVMSQGELHALALSLFLPRASMAASPFRFLVLDDPVQAMDPAKVDGLVQLLGDLAESRQVIVLSHDDRLPAALRRSSAAARLIEVERGTDSRVRITNAEDPASRYLHDAHALVRDEELPEMTLRRTLPGLLRLSVESAARERFFRESLGAGEALEQLETTWSNTQTTKQRVSLAVHGEVKDLTPWAQAPYRKVGLGIVSAGFHQGLRESNDPGDAVKDVERLVSDLRSGA